MKSIYSIFCSLIFAIPLSIYAQEFAAPQINPYSLESWGSRSSPAFAAIDQDGDIDLFTGLVSGDFGIYENIGANNWPSFGPFVIKPFNIGSIGGNATPFLVDLDNDGDFDLFAGGTGGLRYYENLGDATIAAYGPEVQSPFSIISPPGICKPYMADIDYDDDMDLFVGTTDGDIYFYENTGNIANPAFAAALINPFNLGPIGMRSSPALADFDDDSDFDLLIGEKGGDLHYFENIGSPLFAYYEPSGVNSFNLENVGDDAKPYFGDLDDDGDLDLMVGNALGEYYYFENVSINSIGEFENVSASIYPNPFREFTKIELLGLSDREYNLIITDMYGRELIEAKLLKAHDHVIISREILGAGIFLAYLQGKHEMLFLGKLLVE